MGFTTAWSRAVISTKKFWQTYYSRPTFYSIVCFFPRISLLEHDVMFPKSIINVGAWRSVSLFGCYSTGSETVRHDEDGRAPFFFATETYFPLLQSFQL